MNLHSDPLKGTLPAISYAASVVVHALIFFVSGVLLHFSFSSQAGSAGYIEVMTSVSEVPVAVKEQPVPEEAVTEESDVSAEEKPVAESKLVEKATPPSAARNITFNSANTDTSSLNNIYSEKTLNVSIKYPAGWAYIDQNRKNKLDGVTFMAASGSIKPPPYVHLAVQTKDMFIESRYKYSIKTWNYTAYYNDPEEMAGQISQVFYIRTETDEDYSIKFIMQGMDNFKGFQPVFFGMVKTFKFGNGWF